MPLRQQHRLGKYRGAPVRLELCSAPDASTRTGVTLTDPTEVFVVRETTKVDGETWGLTTKDGRDGWVLLTADEGNERLTTTTSSPPTSKSKVPTTVAAGKKSTMKAKAPARKRTKTAKPTKAKLAAPAPAARSADDEDRPPSADATTRKRLRWWDGRLKDDLKEQIVRKAMRKATKKARYSWKSKNAVRAQFDEFVRDCKPDEKKLAKLLDNDDFLFKLMQKKPLDCTFVNVFDRRRSKSPVPDALADAIKNSGALTSLNISASSILSKASGKALADALAQNTVLKSLDISDNQALDGIGFANELAVGLSTNGASSYETINQADLDQYFAKHQFTDRSAADVLANYNVTEIKAICNAQFGEEPTITVVPKAKGALVKFNARNNEFYAEGGKALAGALQDNKILKELNISSINLSVNYSIEDDMSGIIAISGAIPTMGALVKFDISNNALRAEGTKVLARALKGNKSMTDINISSNEMRDGRYDFIGGGKDLSGVLEIANTIPTMGALETLRIGGNRINGAEAGKALSNALAANTVLKELDLSSQCDSRSGQLDAACAKELGVGLRMNRALVKFDISANNLKPEGAKALAEGLKNNKIMRELNIAANKITDDGEDMSGAVAIGDAIPTMGALIKFDISDNDLCSVGTKAVAEALKGNQNMTELNISSNYACMNNDTDEADMSGVIAIRDAIPTMGALENLHIGDNEIPIENMSEIIDIVDATPATKVLCAVPFRDKTIAELDVSGQRLGVEGALVVRRYLEKNGAMTTLDISHTRLGNEGSEAIAEALRENQVMKNLNLSKNDAGPKVAQILAEGVIANGALARLNIRANNIGRVVPPEGWTMKREKFDGKRQRVFTHRDGRKQIEDPGSTRDGAIAIADAISANKTLVKLDISSNDIEDDVLMQRIIALCDTKSIELVH
jgi:Ran GTPase-activating protein (RanGAP) involved in mRNA processing and transport